MHGSLIGMKQSMFGVFDRLFGRMIGSDVMLGVAVLPCLPVMLVGCVVMVGGDAVTLRYGQIERGRHRS